MSPGIKFGLARVGLFVLCTAPLVLIFRPASPADLLLYMMIGVLASAIIGFFALRGLRDQVSGQVATAIDQRRAEKQRLRSALSGEDGAVTAPDPEEGSDQRR